MWAKRSVKCSRLVWTCAAECARTALWIGSSWGAFSRPWCGRVLVELAGARPILRAARPDEGPVLSAIARASKAHWGYPKAWLDAWRDELTIDASLIERLRVTVAEQAEPMGFSALTVDGERAELEHLWVLPDAIGHGLGRRLFHDAVDAAADAGARRLVIVSDPNAAPFYERMGARKTGEERSELFGQPRVLPVHTLRIHTEDP